MKRTMLLHQAAHEYKANLHAHTTRSDGVFSPEELRTLYRENGYQVLAYTDHHTFYDSRNLCEDGFLALSGYELNFDQRDPRSGHVLKTCHINAIATDPAAAVPVPDRTPYDIGEINKTIRALNDGGFIVNLNHTAWSNQPTEDVLAIEGNVGMELYNTTCDDGFEGMGELHRYMQTIRAGRRVLPIAADDVHRGAFRYGRPWAMGDGCRAFVMIRADRLAAPDVLAALRAGHYYCSNGPRIHEAYIEGDRVVVECSPVCGAYLKTGFVGYQRIVQAASDTLTHVEFDLRGFDREPFLMVQITDSMGQFACTVPFYGNE